MIANFLNLFKVPEIRKRIFITLGFLVVYRVGWNIPIPGIDLDVLRAAAEQNADGGSSFAQLFSLISGGGLSSCALFSLGIMPYISASIIFSLLTKVVPSLEAVAKEGAAGQRKINQWTRLATLPLCLVQALILVGNVFKTPVDGVGQPFLPDGFWLAVNAVLALTAGAILLMWIGEQITEYGVGNGISLLIMAGIIARVPDAMVGLIQKHEGGFLPFALLLLFLVVVLVVVYITKGMRKIPVQYAKLTRGRKVYGGQRHFMPIKVNQAGVMPVIFSSALLSFPNLLGQAFGWEAFSRAFTPGQWWYTVSDIALIFFFSFFWNSLMFNPVEMSKNMKESGAFIPGIRPGKKTAEFLQKVMTRITLAGATFLAVIASVPQQLASLISAEVPMEVRYFLGGTSILIVVSVALDLVDKLNSALLMRNYGGFMESGGSGRRKRRDGGGRGDRKRGSKDA